MKRLLLLVAALLPGVAVAENYDPYPIGPRASGMGGAFTAIADDAAGVYYNPAAPADTTSETISLSTSLYGFVGGREKNALGQDEHYQYNNYQVIPSSVSTAIRLKSWKGRGHTKWVFSFNIFTPASYELNARVSINNGYTTLYRSRSDQLLMLGPGFAYRFNDKLSVGLVLYGMYHQFNTNYDLTDIFPTNDPGVSDVVQLTNSNETTNYGLSGAIGIKYQPIKHLLLGLSLRFPSFVFANEGEAFSRFIYSFPSAGEPTYAETKSDNVRTNRVLPWRLNLGIGYQKPGKIAVSAQVQMYMPVKYFETFSTKFPDLISERDNKFVINAAVGFEAYLKETWILRMGAFTDFSAARDPIPGVRDTEQINLFGGTFAIGKVAEDTETVFGISAAGGPMKTVGYDLKTSSYEPFLSEGYQYRVFLVYCGSFSI